MNTGQTVIDKNNGTRWIITGFKDNEWLTVRLAESDCLHFCSSIVHIDDVELETNSQN